MSIIEVDEVVAYMGGLNLNTTQRGIVQNVIIPGTQQELELFLNRPVEPVQIRESVLADCDGWVKLRYTPVWKIIGAGYSDGNSIPTTNYFPASITPDPAAKRVIDLSVVGMPALPWRWNVGAWGLSAAAPWGMGTYVTVEYIGGYLGISDEALKLATLRVIAREVANQFSDTAGIRSGTLEAADESDNRTKGWTEDELKRFKRLKRRVIV